MDYETPKNQMHSPRIYVERTLALIKPDAIHQAEEIEDIILRSGFTILQVGVNCLRHAVTIQLASSLCDYQCVNTKRVYFLLGTLPLARAEVTIENE